MKSITLVKAEKIVNIALILAAIMLAFILIKTFILDEFVEKTPKKIATGQILPIPSLYSQDNAKTILLVLQKDCKYCTDSMPFYKRLLESAQNKNIKILAVLPDQKNESIRYFEENNLDVQEPLQMKLSIIGVQGTPTLILLNSKSEVIDSWIGKLTTTQENEVLRNLSADSDHE